MRVAEVKKIDDVYERVLYFVRERESVRLKKEAGLARPWTDDERLLDGKFTNVRRMDDFVSRWLMDHWYLPHWDHPNIYTACCLARLFNLPRILDIITPDVFTLTKYEPPDWERIRTKVAAAWGTGPVFNSAYIVSGEKGKDKVTSVLDWVRAIHADPPPVDRDSMEATWRELCGRRGFGSFTAGQVVADLRWAATGSWKDRGSWASPGPGSKRGIERLLTNSYETEVPAHDWPAEFAKWIRVCRDRLPRSITDRLEAIDYQNMLCDHVDKSERLLWDQGRLKNRYDGRGDGTPSLFEV